VRALRIGLAPDPASERAGAGSSVIFAKALVFNDYRVRYGGADVGLAGLLADRAAAGFERGVGIFVAKDVRSRNRRLIELAEAFAASTGGYGRLEDASELLSCAKRGIGSRPLSFFTFCDFNIHLASLLDDAAREGLIRAEHRAMTVMEFEAAEFIGFQREARREEFSLAYSGKHQG
jgi:predicted Rossmann-fold nucleotide-binding protein